MRPFRFFFLFSLSILVFFFLARFIIVALIGAAVLSFLFFIFRRVRHYFRVMHRDDHHYPHRLESGLRRGLEGWRYEDDLLVDTPTRRPDRLTNYRIIEVQ